MIVRHVMDPQPVIKVIDGGWQIGGMCYIGSTPEYHLKRDDRFMPPPEVYGHDEDNIQDRWVECDYTGEYYWMLVLKEKSSDSGRTRLQRRAFAES